MPEPQRWCLAETGRTLGSAIGTRHRTALVRHSSVQTRGLCKPLMPKFHARRHCDSLRCGTELQYSPTQSRTCSPRRATGEVSSFDGPIHLGGVICLRDLPRSGAVPQYLRTQRPRDVQQLHSLRLIRTALGILVRRIGRSVPIRQPILEDVLQACWSCISGPICIRSYDWQTGAIRAVHLAGWLSRSFV